MMLFLYVMDLNFTTLFSSQFLSFAYRTCFVCAKYCGRQASLQDIQLVLKTILLFLTKYTII